MNLPNPPLYPTLSTIAAKPSAEAKFFSHKLLRVLIPFFMIAVFFMNFALLGQPFYFKLFFVQIDFYLMALLGALLRNEKNGILKGISRVCSIPYVFCLLNFSAFIGFFRFIFSMQQITWEKARKNE